MAGAQSLRGGGEVNVFPGTLGQENTKIHACLPPAMCWAPVVFGVDARGGAALAVVGAVGKAQLLYVEGPAGLEQMCRLGWASVCFYWSLPCLRS